MKILYVTSNTRVGGAENFLLRLAKGIKEHFDVTCVVTNEEGGLQEAYQQLFKDNLYSLNGDISRMEALIDDADIVHLIMGSYGYSRTLALNYGGKKPIVQNAIQNVTENVGLQVMLDETGRGLSAIISECEDYLKWLPVPGQVPHIKKQIMNGIDTTFWTPTDRVPEIGTVCWIGRLTPMKGADVLREIILQMPEVRFNVVANEPLDIEGVLHKEFLDLQGSVANLSYSWSLMPDELKEVYRSSSIYLHTSLTESMPGTLLEAMACGCIPVCGLTPGGMREILPRNDLWCDIKDVISYINTIRYVMDTARFNEIRSYNAIACMREGFSIEKTIRAYRDLYITIARERNICG